MEITRRMPSQSFQKGLEERQSGSIGRRNTVQSEDWWPTVKRMTERSAELLRFAMNRLEIHENS